MKRTSFTEEQVIGILRKTEAGAQRGNMAPLHHRKAAQLDALSSDGPRNGNAAIWQVRRVSRRQSQQMRLR